MNLIGLGIKVATDSGVKGIVSKACAPYLPEITASVTKRICGQMAVMAISGVVCEEVNNYIDKKVDEIAGLIVASNSAIKKINNGKPVPQAVADELVKMNEENVDG